MKKRLTSRNTANISRLLQVTLTKNLSLKLDDDIFQEMEKIVKRIKKNRNRYINEAVEFYNRLHKRRLLSNQLSKESKMVSRDSLEILAEYEKINDLQI